MKCSRLSGYGGLVYTVLEEIHRSGTKGRGKEDLTNEGSVVVEDCCDDNDPSSTRDL